MGETDRSGPWFSKSNERVKAPPYLQASHLAVLATEAVAAHGIVGKGALLTAVRSLAGTLLWVRDGLHL